MNAIKNIVFGMLFLIGIVLIVAIFFFLFSGDYRANSNAWLNFGVILFLFGVNFLGLWIISSRAKTSDSAVPALLALGGVISIYDLIALILIGISFTGADFRFLFPAHLVAGFLFVLAFAIAFFGLQFVRGVGDAETNLKKSVEAIKTGLSGLELKMKGLSADYDPVKKEISSILDEARYLTPNESSEAAEMERDILADIGSVKTEVDSGLSGGNKDDISGNIQKKFANIKNLLTARKKLYSK